MKIKFNSRIGNIRNFFVCMYLVYNYEQLDEYASALEIHIDKRFIKKLSLLSKKISRSSILDIFLSTQYNIKRSHFYTEHFWKNVNHNEVCSFTRVESVLEYMDNLSENDLRELIVDSIISEYADIIPSNISHPLTFGDITAYLESFDLDASLKWNLFMLYQQPKKYFSEFTRTSREFLPHYKNTFKDEIAKHNEFTDTLKEKVLYDQDNFSLEASKLGFDLSKYDTVYVSTHFVAQNSISSTTVGDSIYLYFSAHYEKTLKTLVKNKSKELNMKRLKFMSDSTRFKTLELISKNEDMYNGQIAKKIGISLSTLSHHLDTLVTVGLITLDKQGQRTYPRINKSAIKELSTFLDEIFDK